MPYKAKDQHIYVVIERKVNAAEGLCDDCLTKGMASRWDMVRRYIVPPDTPYDKLFGIGEGSIEPKGLPDNISTGAVEFLQIIRGEAKQQGLKIRAYTSATEEAIGVAHGHANLVESADFDALAMPWFDLDVDWHDPTPPTPYRIVAWRVGDLPVDIEAPSVVKGVSDV